MCVYWCRVVGVSDLCDYPPEATSKPSVSHSCINSAELSSAEVTTHHHLHPCLHVCVPAQLHSGAASSGLDLLYNPTNHSTLRCDDSPNGWKVPHLKVKDLNLDHEVNAGRHVL